MEKVYEICPHCDSETEIEITGGKCKHCHKFILPCSVCDTDIVKCERCAKEKKYYKVASQISYKIAESRLDSVDRKIALIYYKSYSEKNFYDFCVIPKNTELLKTTNKKGEIK